MPPSSRRIERPAAMRYVGDRLPVGFAAGVPVSIGGWTLSRTLLRSTRGASAARQSRGVVDAPAPAARIAADLRGLRVGADQESGHPDRIILRAAGYLAGLPPSWRGDIAFTEGAALAGVLARGDGERWRLELREGRPVARCSRGWQ